MLLSIISTRGRFVSGNFGMYLHLSLTRYEEELERMQTAKGREIFDAFVAALVGSTWLTTAHWTKTARRVNCTWTVQQVRRASCQGFKLSRYKYKRALIEHRPPTNDALRYCVGEVTTLFFRGDQVYYPQGIVAMALNRKYAALPDLVSSGSAGVHRVLIVSNRTHRIPRQISTRPQTLRTTHLPFRYAPFALGYSCYFMLINPNGHRRRFSRTPTTISTMTI